MLNVYSYLFWGFWVFQLLALVKWNFFTTMWCLELANPYILSILLSFYGFGIRYFFLNKTLDIHSSSPYHHERFHVCLWRWSNHQHWKICEIGRRRIAKSMHGSVHVGRKMLSADKNMEPATTRIPHLLFHFRMWIYNKLYFVYV